MPTPRIGVVTQDFAGAPEAASGEALRIAAMAAERAGAVVRTLTLPEIVAQAWRIHSVVQFFEAHQAMAWEYRANYRCAVPPLLRKRLDETLGITPAMPMTTRALLRTGPVAQWRNYSKRLTCC
jgi:hypothetical protein